MELDEDLVREARQARDRLIGLQHDVEQAQVTYQHAIRRLHAAGGSLRQIANVLGLSYQRVHQIVDVGAGKGAVKRSRTDAECSFCGTGRAEVRKLVAGPGVFVCEQCVDLANEVLAEREEKANERARLASVGAEEPKARCSFCGKRRSKVYAMAEAPDRSGRGKYAKRAAGVRICNDCLALCDDIIAEDFHA